ncbi:hypothetical protein [Ruegeria sp.]|uniref:hypothetical protein n=1 Tax=Ruegeria sp. TaxID=1879320 RepID=UPI002310A179|nr:hypothetical protein [Ruegeria sp.]MDA7963337.1 hypothetical protein [Ruegeria sp.]
MKISIATLIAGIIGIQAAAASTATYECKITKESGLGWVPPDYSFQINTAGRDAKVHSNYHDWTDAKYKLRNDGEYRILWNVTLRASDGQNLRMKYQANLDTKQNTVRIRASFANTSASNKPFGTGSCVLKSS